MYIEVFNFALYLYMLLRVFLFVIFKDMLQDDGTLTYICKIKRRKFQDKALRVKVSARRKWVNLIKDNTESKE